MIPQRTAKLSNLCVGCTHHIDSINGEWCRLRRQYTTHMRINNCKDYGEIK